MITAGIDVGNKFTKTVIARDKGIIALGIAYSGFNQKNAAQESYEQAVQRAGLDEKEIRYTAATGNGQNEVDFADGWITNISSAAKGTVHLLPQARTIADVGAEEARTIRIDGKGKVLDFAINEKCAAGAGSFVETMADALEVDLEDMGQLSLESSQPVAMNAQCAVFAESEVVSLIHANTPKEDIARAIHDAIASRTASLIRRVGLVKEMSLIGGMAKNPGFIQALQEDMEIQLLIPENPEFVSAYGAALAAAERL